ncbi:DUF1592 domain-containing protein [Stieleria sp. JC731]|uniref:DUF1592 domain-containing protein n=1 Tax=Stieleria sp. JC731 TaxID=2894195 RepID=UPI001E43D362|nr:DUF1592 domain-containing protein [Stieleria sp. JC731]MCC9603329.1 DUF1592 domain-containing protein [Stieleria sp. JC731]
MSANDRLDLVAEFMQTHCLDCHSGDEAERSFRLDHLVDRLSAAHDGDDATKPTTLESQTKLALEKSFRRLMSRQMPPADVDIIAGEKLRSVQNAIDSVLASDAKRNPYAGTTEAIRRMTRIEYQNSIEDLLGIHIDVAAILPPDSSSDGFDNITVDDLSPLLLERYLTAATRISRVAIGASIDQPLGLTVRVPADQTQQDHVAGLPFGTRGGFHFTHQFPKSGEYSFSIRLMRDRDENIEGIYETHQMDVLLDRNRVKRFTLDPPGGSRGHSEYDKHLNFRMWIDAGDHDVAVTFVENATSLLEIKRQPFDASYNRHRHPRRTPAVAEVNLVGPFIKTEKENGTTDLETGQYSTKKTSDVDTADEMFRRWMKLAYRRAITEEDLRLPRRYFDEAIQHGGDDAFSRGIEAGLTSILASPHFLFKTVAQPNQYQKGAVYPITSDEVATRLASFIWSSLPDEELMAEAWDGSLSHSEGIRQQTLRMLQNPKRDALVDNFAAQWLYLRNLPTITPDLRQFPSFDNNLREAFSEETKRLVADVIRRDASVLELIQTDHAYLNERLAIHYGIGGVVGSHFRQVQLEPDSHRGGLLRQGSILMATSYATRTSPTKRGAWVLENILGTPPPPPPPNVPTIREKHDGGPVNFREALAQHRNDASCASCHNLIDPVGFAMDQFDAVGRFRTMIDGRPVDASGTLPDGTVVNGIAELEQGILKFPEMFVTALTEKLMTYALGRPVTEFDGPEVRRIVELAKENDYRFSSIVCGITTSVPFRNRTAQ